MLNSFALSITEIIQFIIMFILDLQFSRRHFFVESKLHPKGAALTPVLPGQCVPGFSTPRNEMTLSYTQNELVRTDDRKEQVWNESRYGGTIRAFLKGKINN